MVLTDCQIRPDYKTTRQTASSPTGKTLSVLIYLLSTLKMDLVFFIQFYMQCFSFYLVLLFEKIQFQFLFSSAQTVFDF